MKPPRIAELILAGFLGDQSLEQAVLGDFHEEWVARMLRDGEGSANRWYWRQALETVPYLFAAWIRLAHWSGGRSMAIAVVMAFIVVTGLSVITGSMMSVFFSALGVPLEHWSARLAWTVVPIACLCAAGAVAARIARRAPLASVAAFGVFLLSFQVLLLVARPEPQPHWNFYVVLTFMLPAVMSGGVLATRSRHDKSIVGRRDDAGRR